MSEDGGRSSQEINGERRGLISRFLRATLRHVRSQDQEAEEEAEELLGRINALEEGRERDGISLNISRANERSGDGNDQVETEQNLLQMLREMPYARMAKTLVPLVALLLTKLVYELMPYVISLCVIVGTFEYIDKQFRTHISLSKSMMPSPRWIFTLLNFAVTVAVLSHIVLEKMTAIKGLNESLLFGYGNYAGSTSSIVTLIWALLILASLANLYVLIVQLAVTFVYICLDQCSSSFIGEGVAHRDDEVNSIEENENFLNRYERLITLVDSMHYILFLWRSMLPVRMWLAFYGEARFAAHTLEVIYVLCKAVELVYKSYAVYVTLGRTLGGGKALVGVPAAFQEIEELGDKTCPICMESLEERCPIRLQACSHIFCRRCIQTWTSGKPEPTCAVCRAPIEINEDDKQIDRYEAELKSHSGRWCLPIL